MTPSSSAFPLPLHAVRVLGDAAPPGFLVVAMFTADYAERAERLRRSCAQFGVAHAIHEVPTVHDSISRSGSPELAYTKANLIANALAQHRRPVLYIDADCELREPPVLIDALLSRGCEFAVYNWAADEQTDAYLPLKVTLDGEASTQRFFRFASSFDYYDPDQLLCSGAVQLYAHTPGAHAFLAHWHATIARLPGSADDHCLDFAFNNRGAALAGLRAEWLPKAYARYAWWIYVKPVIDHPQMANVAGHFKPVAGQFDSGRAAASRARPPFPRDCVIDVQAARLVKFEGGKLVDVGPAGREFWV